MKLGTSEDTRVGEWVIAMGSPLSLTNTITTGVISTVSRTSKDLKLFDKDMQYLQTDAIITVSNVLNDKSLIFILIKVLYLSQMHSKLFNLFI